jgi:hypothetical protein
MERGHALLFLQAAILLDQRKTPLVYFFWLNWDSRMCNESVCGDCSKGQVKSERVCDVCKYKVENVTKTATKGVWLEQ